MASVTAKESKSATQTVSVTVVNEPTTSGLASTNILVHKANTTEQLLNLLSDHSKVILIEFFAEWCGPCKLIAQKLEKWAKAYDVTIVKVDVDELEEIALEYNVTGIPTFAFIKDNQKLEQLEGSHEDRIIAALEKYCKKPEYNMRLQDRSETYNRTVEPFSNEVNSADDTERKL